MAPLLDILSYRLGQLVRSAAAGVPHQTSIGVAGQGKAHQSSDNKD